MADGDVSTVSVGPPAASAGAGGLLANRRVLLIGGGAVVLALVVYMMRRGGATANPDNESIDGATTPDQALALGSLESRVAERTGRLEEILATLGGNVSGGFAGVNAGLGGLGDDLSGLRDLTNSGFGSVWDQIVDGQFADTAEAHEIRTGINTLLNPAGAQEYRDAQTAFEAWLLSRRALAANPFAGSADSSEGALP